MRYDLPHNYELIEEELHLDTQFRYSEYILAFNKVTHKVFILLDDLYKRGYYNIKPVKINTMIEAMKERKNYLLAKKKRNKDHIEDFDKVIQCLEELKTRTISTTKLFDFINSNKNYMTKYYSEIEIEENLVQEISFINCFAISTGIPGIDIYNHFYLNEEIPNNDAANEKILSILKKITNNEYIEFEYYEFAN